MWSGIKTRCFNPRAKSFGKYGGKGITMCEAWRSSFPTFLRDMGPRPSSAHSVDRIKNNGNYEPSNCRWATRIEQSNNTSRNNFITANGKTETLANWARELGVHTSTIRRRLAAHGTIEGARHPKIT